MKKVAGLLMVFGVLLTFAFNRSAETEEGIEFSHITFKEAKEIAKKENKLIFIDCYASWCGPCKRMAATSFKDANVGEIYNNNFINLKIDMEKDPEGPELARLFRIQAYPTLVFVDGNGKVKQKEIGMLSATQLIALAKQQMN